MFTRSNELLIDLWVVYVLKRKKKQALNEMNCEKSYSIKPTALF